MKTLDHHLNQLKNTGLEFWTRVGLQMAKITNSLARRDGEIKKYQKIQQHLRPFNDKELNFLIAKIMKRKISSLILISQERFSLGDF